MDHTMDKRDPFDSPSERSLEPRGARSTRLLMALARYGVRFVLFGTAGAWAHGAQVTVRDVDICPDPDPGNLGRLAACLDDLAARPIGAPNDVRDGSWAPGTLTLEWLARTFETEAGLLDVVPSPFGPGGDGDRLDYASLDARATTRILAGQPLRVANVEDLLASKRRSARFEDRATVRELLRAVGTSAISGESGEHGR